MTHTFTLVLACLALLGCRKDTLTSHTTAATLKPAVGQEDIPYDTPIKTIHIFVALCDNKYQGIVPVPAGIGNGQDPDTNLYWGCGYGIRTHFKKSKEWKFLKSTKLGGHILERVVFRHAAKPGQYLVADAYDGQYIKECTTDFLDSSAGNRKDAISIDGKSVGIGGNAQMLAYIGHDGLMDFELDENFKNTDGKKRDVIILACYSKMFFGPHLKEANVNPLVWSTHLMAPEAYIVHDAITGYLNGETPEQIRSRAATAYNKYQKCGEKAARKLLVAGW